jgi:hypothetical protein
VFAGYLLLAAVFWFAALFWASFAYHDSIDVGAAYFVFLGFVYIVFSFFALRLRFLPSSGWRRYFSALGVGLFIMALWSGAGVVIARIVKL